MKTNILNYRPNGNTITNGTAELYQNCAVWAEAQVQTAVLCKSV